MLLPITPNRRRPPRPRLRPSSTTPPAVVSVAVALPDELSAIWTFDQDVTDPTSDVAPFLIDALNAADWTRVDARTLHFYYTDVLAPGMAWSNPAGAAGVTGTDG